MVMQEIIYPIDGKISDESSEQSLQRLIDFLIDDVPEPMNP